MYTFSVFFFLSILGIVWENTTPSAELPCDCCAGIGPLQLGIVLVYLITKQRAVKQLIEIWRIFIQET